MITQSPVIRLVSQFGHEGFRSLVRILRKFIALVESGALYSEDGYFPCITCITLICLNLQGKSVGLTPIFTLFTRKETLLQNGPDKAKAVIGVSVLGRNTASVGDAGSSDLMPPRPAPGYSTDTFHRAERIAAD